MTDLYPKLCIMFPLPWLAQCFADNCNQYHELDLKIVGSVIEISGADHPEFRKDLLFAAKIIGGDEVPEKRNQ
jgi:hypothetical protein